METNYISPRTNKPVTIVDEGFKITPELEQAGATITWFWRTEIWKVLELDIKTMLTLDHY